MPSSNVPWEKGCGPADPALSASFSSYTGTGYNPIRGGTGAVGTINTGNPSAAGSPNSPAQVRFYIQGGSLYALDNVTGQSYFVSPSAIVPTPGNYSPTR